MTKKRAIGQCSHVLAKSRCTRPLGHTELLHANGNKRWDSEGVEYKLVGYSLKNSGMYRCREFAYGEWTNDLYTREWADMYIGTYWESEDGQRQLFTEVAIDGDIVVSWWRKKRRARKAGGEGQ